MKEKRLKGGVRPFMQKLARGLMLPIALLPIAGLFLGIGAGIENIMKLYIDVPTGTDPMAASTWFLIPLVLKNIGDVVFGNLPVLFAIAIAIAYTEDAGVAALSALVGWIVFSVAQSTMIWPNMIPDPSDPAKEIIGSYDILWYKNVPTSVVTTNVGITSMQTSVFGGLCVGFLVAFLYNKFHTYQMPKVLGFFSGTRLVPIVTFLIVPVLGFFFLMVWPIAGIGLESLGKSLSSAPLGTDALAFGYVERILIPFGLHHAFYTPLWYTSVGGQFQVWDVATQAWNTTAEGNQRIWFEVLNQGINFNTLTSSPVDPTGVSNVIGTGWQYVDINGDHIAEFRMTAGVSPGAYMQGKYAFMIFGLPAAGLAMVMAAKGKENRQVAASVIISAAFTAFLTGITEPIEFTFLFLAPWLFFGFHAMMAAGSFWIMDLVGANIGMTFSGGIFDYVIYGTVPNLTGSGTDSWNALWLGAVYAPIYYVVFYYAITLLDIPTPGRGGETELKTKVDYLTKKDSGQKVSGGKGPSKARVDTLVKNLGGIDNLASIDACITRLRLSVKDRSKVDDAGLKQMGAMGIVGKNKAIQVIFGAEADIFKTKLLEIKKSKNKK